MGNESDLQPMFHGHALIVWTQLQQHLPYCALLHTLHQIMTSPAQYHKHTHTSAIIQILTSAELNRMCLCDRKFSEFNHR